MVQNNLDQWKVEGKAHWENKTVETIRNNRVKNKVEELITSQRVAAMDERRAKLQTLYDEERKVYEFELGELTKPNPQKAQQEMATRAYELKKRREDEKTEFVQEKLYQQWREGIDELRHADAKLFELQVTYERGVQKDEKIARQEDEAREKMIYDALWQEGYHAKVERELREKEVRGKLSGQVL